MFENLLKRLMGDDTSEKLPETDGRIAMAALMVRLARSDNEYAADEITLIDTVLAQKYDLSADAAETLRREAEVLEAEAPDTVRFTRAIKNAVPYEDRNAVVENLWRIALADGVRDHHEDGFLRLVANLLGVSDVDSAVARQKAQKG